MDLLTGSSPQIQCCIMRPGTVFCIVFCIFQGRKEGDRLSKIDSAYAYYLMTYGNKATSRYDSHKKSELRSIYNRMVKANTDSPLFKLNNPDDAKVYAIDIKESAKSIQNVVSSLSDAADNSIESAFLKKLPFPRMKIPYQPAISAMALRMNPQIISRSRFRSLPSPRSTLATILITMLFPLCPEAILLI